MDGRLRRLSFLLAMHVWHKRDMYQCKIIMANSKLELPHGFNKRSRFYISDSSSELRTLEVCAFKDGNRAYLYNTEVRLLARIVDRDFGDAVYPILDSVRDMGYDLPGVCHSLIRADCDHNPT